MLRNVACLLLLTSLRVQCRRDFAHDITQHLAREGQAAKPVYPGQAVEPFTVDTATGIFSFDPRNATRAAIVHVFNPLDPFQQSAWADWSLRMFLRQAPLYGADYVLAPYVSRPDAAVDVSYWMYSRLIGAARDVYGSNETSDEELRKRVFAHVHLAVSPGIGISPQIDAIQSQWTQDMRVLHARLADAPAKAAVTEAADMSGSSHLGSTGSSSSLRRSAARSLDRIRRLAAQSRASASAAATATGDDATAAGWAAAFRAAADAAAAATTGGSTDTQDQEATASAAEAVAEIDDLVIPRLDGWYGWIPSPAAVSPTGQPAPLVALPPRHSPCDPFWATAHTAAPPGLLLGGPRLAGAWVLVANASRDPADDDCTYTRVLLNMQAAGALGVVFMASPDQDVEVVAPEGETQAAEFDGASGGASSRSRATRRFCPRGAMASLEAKQEDEEQQPTIPATMVSYYDGLDLHTLLAEAASRNTSSSGGGGVVVEFGTQKIPGAWLVADPEVGLAEAGWAALPLMVHGGWAAWWHVYLGRLRADLRRSNERGDEVVHVMQKQSISGPHGASVTALVPRSPASRFSRMQLNLALGCEGSRFDAGCPAWDHMVQLFVCCDDQSAEEAEVEAEGGEGVEMQGPQKKKEKKEKKQTCAACPTTLWGPQGAGRGAKGGPGDGQEEEEALCGVELGRWATPFRRRVGRWMTDVSPMLAALGGGGKCKFTVQTTPWADGNWTVTLELRLGRGPPAAAAAGAAAATTAGATRVATTEQQQLAALTEQQLRDSNNKVPDRAAAAHAAAMSQARAADGRRRRALAVAASAAHALNGRSRASGALERPAAGKDAPLRPFSYLPLFGSAPFDSRYNADRPPASFPTPPTARAAALVGYVTGHGADPEANCAEFCPVSHTLYVNGREIAVLNWTDAGTEWGCADDVLYGGVPNQHGTWYYGRGGWCDGAAVRPWIVDITDALLPPAPAPSGVVSRSAGGGAAANNTLWIKGLGPGGREPWDPPADAGSGYIMMSTGVVWYE